jgi:cyanophycinase-like exopeptidase
MARVSMRQNFHSSFFQFRGVVNIDDPAETLGFCQDQRSHAVVERFGCSAFVGRGLVELIDGTVFRNDLGG